MRSRLLSIEGGDPDASSGGAAAAVADPPASSNGDGKAPEGAASDWRTAIPETIRSEPMWQRFKDLPAALQSHHDLQKRLGSAITIPGKDAKPEEVAAFREKLGVPKDATGYAAPKIEGLDPDRWSKWAGQAHKLGLTPAQLEGLAAFEAEERQGMVTNVRQQFAEGLETLRKEWGDHTFSRNVTLASRAVDRFGSPELKRMLDESGYGDHPEWVKAWANVGKLLAEDGYIDGRVEGMPTTDEAKAKIAAIRADRNHPANNPSATGHKEADAALQELYKIAYGTGEIR